jgi:hypothetical protein
MKKWLLLVIAGVLVLALTGCPGIFGHYVREEITTNDGGTVQVWDMEYRWYPAGPRHWEK